MRNKLAIILALALVFVMLLPGCAVSDETKNSDNISSEGKVDKSAEETNSGEFTIGVSFATLQEERYKREVETMEQWLKENYPNAKFVFQGADYDANKQYTQCETLITQGVDMLIVNCQDIEIGASIVNMAKAAGVLVCGYDYELMNCEVDVFVTQSLVVAGELMAQWTMDHLDFTQDKVYKVYMMEGDATARNAALCKQGKMNILQSYIDEGKIEIVGEQWCDNWSSESGLANMENALTALNNEVDAVIASNDGIATGVCQALDAQGLSGRVIVTGQDGELAACQRIVEGTQSMTVYKPGLKMATTAIETAVNYLLGNEIEYDSYMDNGKIKVPTVLPPIYAVDVTNMDETVIADGWQAKEEVYKNVG